MKINATEHVGPGFPENEGKQLADHLLQLGGLDWTDLEIDVRGFPAGFLISAFFNGFFQAIRGKSPNLLESARMYDMSFKEPTSKSGPRTSRL